MRHGRHAQGSRLTPSCSVVPRTIRTRRGGRAATLGVEMIAPRRKQPLGLAGNRTHHPTRLLTVQITQADGAAARMMWIHRERDGIER